MLITVEVLRPLVLKRKNETHKGDYGHTCLVCGCDSMPGAASLATAAALKSGCGLVTLHTSSYAAMISAVANPSAILSIDRGHCFTDCDIDLSRYNSIGAGPGLGKDIRTAKALENLLRMASEAGIPMVIDADAINLIALNPSLLAFVSGCVMTPHDGELARLLSWIDEKDKLLKIRNFSNQYGVTVIAKGYRTKVFVPGEDGYYENTTGNPGMAKGGSGDVLTGLAAGLLARGYSPSVAALLAVWLHGYAGDCCTAAYGPEAYSSKDLLTHLHEGFLHLL